MLNFNEQRVLNLIEEDPFLSQQAIADQLDVPRSTVATIVSNLTAKKHLLGRAYVVNKQPEVFCIGAMNVDRKFVLDGELVLETSNPVSSHVSIGGVARNLSENLGRLDVKASLLSLAGNDKDYELIKQQTQGFVNLQHVQQLSDCSTSTYTAILEPNGEMKFAFADMDICQSMTPEWIESYHLILSQARMMVVDLNAPKQTIEKIIEISNKETVALMLVSVSCPKMTHLPNKLKGVKWLIVNQEESKAYFNNRKIEVTDAESMLKAWMRLGVENVVMTCGSENIYYANHHGQRYCVKPPVVNHIVDVTGAGDAFAAGIAYAYLQKMDYKAGIELAMTNSYVTIQSTQTVRKDLNEAFIQTQLAQLKKEGKIRD